MEFTLTFSNGTFAFDGTTATWTPADGSAVITLVNQDTVAQPEPATEVHVTEGEEIKVVEDDAPQSTQSA